LNTLTVYNEGLNDTEWNVNAPSATGTANRLHCGPGWTANGGTGGSVCTTTYPINFQFPFDPKKPISPSNPKLPPNTIILEAKGGAFGGWSYTCTPSDPEGNPIPLSAVTADGPNYCTVTFGPTAFSGLNEQPILNTNVTVGAIFN
jgi:hypothetical protein